MRRNRENSPEVRRNEEKHQKLQEMRSCEET